MANRNTSGRVVDGDAVQYDGEDVTRSELAEASVAVLTAAKDGSVAALEAALSNPEADVNHFDGNGRAALHFAVHAGSLECVEWLLDHGADLEMLDNDDHTPLLLAVKLSGEQNDSAIVDALLARGANINAETRRGSNVIHEAAANGDVAMVERLHAAGAQILDGKVEAGNMGGPLVRAADNGHVDVIRKLLELGASVNAADGNGITPLHVAAGVNNADVVAVLLNAGANPNALIGMVNATPLHMAADYQAMESVRALVDAGAALVADMDGSTPYDLAKAKGWTEGMEVLAECPRMTVSGNSAGAGAATLVSETEGAAERAVRLKDVGNTHFRNGDWAGAIKCYSRAIQIDDTQHTFFSNRAQAFLYREEWSKARADAEACIALKPDFIKGHFRCGKACVGMGDTEAARTAFEQVLAIDPDHADAADALASLSAADA